MLVSVILLVWWGYYKFVTNYDFQCLGGAGVFGDSFGALNTLFSGLAFAGIILTIFMQKEELKLQRKELKMQREEMKRFADAQEKSEEALGKTATLTALNTLLEYNNNKIDSLWNILIDFRSYAVDLNDKQLLRYLPF